MSQAKIGHSKLSLEQIDRREANLICAGHFLAILAIFGGPKRREDVNFLPSKSLFSSLLNMERKLEKRNGVQIIFRYFFQVSQNCQFAENAQKLTPPQKKQFLTFKSSYLPCFSIKFRNSFWRIPIKGILITGNLKN